MPNTIQFGDDYWITTSYDGQRRGLHFATAEIVDRLTKERVGRVFEGEGTSLRRAEDRALAAAKQWLYDRPRKAPKADDDDE